MRILDRFSLLKGRRTKHRQDLTDDSLRVSEIRLILNGQIEDLSDFASSNRLNKRDPKGDTPLHLAARKGNLALCDLFVRSGAEILALNHKRQTAADVARQEGNDLVSQLLASLSGQVLNSENDTKRRQIGSTRTHINESPEHSEQLAQDQKPTSQKISSPRTPISRQAEEYPIQTDFTSDAFDELLSFEIEETPQSFLQASGVEKAAGSFVSTTRALLDVTEEGLEELSLDRSSVQIAGDGIRSSGTKVERDDHAFLKVRKRGPQSSKQAVKLSGTRLSINTNGI
ncbi:ankyrin repeat domain-containing protein [Cohaesibacter sp. ES.047]|uniref:ankyrin repeat domain-containing protein n=1 Tax=Cohaesibacter sp. ES.047 TaxID=1798205 RepID=UPI000BB8C476|nr:ankyrin repeat domain-containing protein [Cohaesibacter sp. ES.047]